jgi:cytochrome c-type biogenesis protein
VINAFIEGVRSLHQVCHLVILAPVALMIVAARGRWEAVAGGIAGVVTGGWIFASGWVTVSDLALRVSAVLLIAAVVGLGAPRLFGRDQVVRSPAAIGAITVGIAILVTQWWRPCVGEELGSILTNAPDRPWAQLLPTIGFMLGISMPLVAIGMLYAAWPPGPSTATRLGWVGCGLTVVLGVSVLAGQHGEIVSRLFQWSQ